MKDTKKQQVTDLLMSFETKDLLALEVIHPSRFIQHNLTIEDGMEGNSI